MSDDRAAQIEELRFAKTQQWSAAVSAVTLLAAILGVSRLVTLARWEKIVGAIFVLAIVVFACWFLYKQYDHLKNTRLKLDPNDQEAWYRGVDVTIGLALTVIASGLVVGYLLLCHFSSK